MPTNDKRIDKYLNDLGFEHESTLSGSSHLRAKRSVPPVTSLQQAKYLDEVEEMIKRNKKNTTKSARKFLESLKQKKTQALAKGLLE